MKFLFTIFALLSSLMVYAQSYIPLVVESATWIIYDNSLEFNNDYYAFRIEGDTLIASQAYKKVYLYDLEDIRNSPYVVLDRYLAGVLREDLIERKVYGKLYTHPLSNAYGSSCIDSTLNTEETLLINFDVGLGQTFEDCNILSDNQSATIVSDAYEYLFGRNRRILENEFGNKLIEGIGYETGLFAVLGFIHASKPYSLYTYCQGYLYNCNILTTTKDLSLDLKLIPNPTTSKFCIDSTWPVNEIQVFNMEGKCVYKEWGNQKCYTLNLEDGLYIIQAINNNNRHLSKLLISK